MSNGALSEAELARWWAETGEWELRQLLFWRWDPLDVDDYFPNTVDEYDSYTEVIKRALIAKAEPDKVVSTMRDIEVNRMCLDPGLDNRREEVASMLREWFEQSTWAWRRHGPPRH